MNELIKTAETISNLAKGLKAGMEKFTGMLPIIVEQHITKLATDKLNSTRDAFLGAVKSETSDYVLVVTLDEDDWLANAVESGADPFSMKDTHLKSPKARYGKPDKNGVSYKYLRIPIGKEKDAKPGGTDKARMFQKKINEVMMKPSFGMRRLKTMMDGRITETQPVLSTDPDLSGLYRTRQFANSEEFHKGSKKPKWNLVLFRTITENPLARSKWEHPGIRPAGIFKETESWLQANAEAMLATFLETEISKIEGL